MQVFLSIWKEPSIINSVVTKKPTAYHTIARRMRATLRGTKHVQRDPYEIRLKMNALTSKYNAVVAEKERTGSKNARWGWFKDMEVIMKRTAKIKERNNPKYKKEAGSTEGRNIDHITLLLFCLEVCA